MRLTECIKFWGITFGLSEASIAALPTLISLVTGSKYRHVGMMAEPRLPEAEL